MDDPFAVWAQDQRALARALGLSIEEWLKVLADAGQRNTGLTAAVIGAGMAKGLGMSVLDGLDGVALAERARQLIDPTPPRVENPVLKEAIRRSAELGGAAGAGRSRLKGRKKALVPTPQRATSSLGESSTEGSADAPGPSPSKPLTRADRRRAREEEE